MNTQPEHFDTPYPNELTLYEYKLLAHTDEYVQRKIMAEKQYFEDEYEAEVATTTQPHIIVARFFAKEVMEATLCRWIQRICGQHQRFTVALNNFSGIPTHAIYLRVQDPQPFRQLAHSLRVLDTFICANECPPIQLITKPYLPIARQLNEVIYHKAIRQYAHRCFHESFEVTEILLLKRENQHLLAVGRPLSATTRA